MTNGSLFALVADTQRPAQFSLDVIQCGLYSNESLERPSLESNNTSGFKMDLLYLYRITALPKAPLQ